MTVRVHRVDHPIVDDALAIIRAVDTPNPVFRAHLNRIANVVLIEATRSLPTVGAVVTTPITDTGVQRIGVQPVIVPVLRAGLGFVRAAQDLLPDADVGFVGLARNEDSFAAEPYLTKLPPNLDGRPILIVDPMLATGGSLAAAVDHVNSRRVTDTTPVIVACALAAPEGIDHLTQHDTDIDLFVGAIDDRLNDRAFIVPGLGDAGDRLFGEGD